MKCYLFLVCLLLSFNISAQNLNELYQLRSQVQESIIQLRTQLDTLEKQMYLIEMEIHKQKGGTVGGIPVPEPSKPVRYSSPSSSSSTAESQSLRYKAPTGQQSQPIRPTARAQVNQLYTESSVSTSSQTVYVTETGVKYHRGSCHHLRRSKHKTNMLSATKQGYSPCKDCSPGGTTTKQNKKRKSTYRTTSVRCAATTQKGTRCKRMVRGGSYCWQH